MKDRLIIKISNDTETYIAVVRCDDLLEWLQTAHNLAETCKATLQGNMVHLVISAWMDVYDCDGLCTPGNHFEYLEGALGEADYLLRDAADIPSFLEPMRSNRDQIWVRPDGDVVIATCPGKEGNTFMTSTHIPLLQMLREVGIIQGILNVEAWNDQFRQPNPDGGNPVCKNALYTYTCERCGRDVREHHGPCPAVPREQRWGAPYTGPKP